LVWLRGVKKVGTQQNAQGGGGGRAGFTGPGKQEETGPFVLSYPTICENPGRWGLGGGA